MQVDLFSTLRDRLVVPADDADQTFIVANLEGTGFQPEGLDPFELDALESVMDDDPYEGVADVDEHGVCYNAECDGSTHGR